MNNTATVSAQDVKKEQTITAPNLYLENYTGQSSDLTYITDMTIQEVITVLKRYYMEFEGIHIHTISLVIIENDQETDERYKTVLADMDGLTHDGMYSEPDYTRVFESGTQKDIDTWLNDNEFKSEDEAIAAGHYTRLSQIAELDFENSNKNSILEELEGFLGNN